MELHTLTLAVCSSALLFYADTHYLHTLKHTCPSTHLHMYTCYFTHSPHTPYPHTHHIHYIHTLITYTIPHTHHIYYIHTLTTYTLSSQSCNCRATPPRCLPQSLLPSNGDELDLCPPRVVDLICWQQWGIPHILLHRHCGSLRTTPGLNLGEASN